MPRKKRIYWINVPRDLTKCHSRRCDNEVLQDRLCKSHFITWKMAGFQPPMPESYAGTVMESAKPPLLVELKQEEADIKDAIDWAARIPLDDAKTPAQLQELADELQQKKVEIAEKKRDTIAPYEAAIRRESSWFTGLEKQLDRALEVANQRLETSRSTVRSMNVPTERSISRRRVVEMPSAPHKPAVINRKKSSGR